MRVILWLSALTALLILSPTRAEAAACAVAPAVAGNMGSITSYDLRAGSAPVVTLPSTLTCSGSVVSVMPGDYARATATSGNSFRLKSASGASIGYRLSADSGGTMKFTQGSTIDFLDSSVLSLLTILTSNSFMPTLYAAPTEAPNVPAGTYTDTVTIAWSWRICRVIGVGALGVRICVVEDSGTATATVAVSLTVSADCRILAPPVNFGSAPLASGFADVSQAVAVDCTQGTSYKVAFTSGTSGASRPWRSMTDGAGNRLEYNLYRSDGSTIWDEGNPLPGTDPGTGATTPTQLFRYIARINAGSTPSAGSYSDVVSVVVSF